MTDQPARHVDETYSWPAQTPVPPINLGNPAAVAFATNATCTGRYDCPGPHNTGCFGETLESAAYAAERYAAPPTRADLFHLVEAVVTAAGQHRTAAVRVAHARRTLATSELEVALAASDSAHEAERDAVRALRAAITRAVAA